jgi:sugar phosphate isomerase/epimerase
VRLAPDRRLHLTYCTNIHPADGWDAVFANLARYGPPLKRRFSPAGPFGLGLRLSARDARELLAGRRLDDFREWLDREGLYVAIINGFPYGPFHRSVVKADVYAPDWRDDARVLYTLDLIEILRRLLPADVDGGVSTAPLSYKRWMREDDADAWRVVTANVVRIAEALVGVRQERGAVIHLDIEPEPDCVLETSAETIRFFDEWLLPHGATLLAGRLGCSVDDARRHLLTHVRVCFDCCHFAVEYEDPHAALDRLAAAGIQIGRAQLSSAIRVPLPARAEHAAPLTNRLRSFTDPVYLHQVIERANASLRHFPDLDVALDSAALPPPDGAAGREWRIHFHVPLFADTYDGLGSTQDYVRTVLGAARTRGFTRHLEIETYTWDVLPAALKIDLLESIGREYEWVLGELHGQV